MTMSSSCLLDRTRCIVQQVLSPNCIPAVGPATDGLQGMQAPTQDGPACKCLLSIYGAPTVRHAYVYPPVQTGPYLVCKTGEYLAEGRICPEDCGIIGCVYSTNREASNLTQSLHCQGFIRNLRWTCIYFDSSLCPLNVF